MSEVAAAPVEGEDPEKRKLSSDRIRDKVSNLQLQPTVSVQKNYSLQLINEKILIRAL
jgi:hypothetical protein